MGRIRIARGFLSRLAHDVRGNTIALVAAAMLPLAGLIGGGVDMSRLYLTKTRLQHACDAGALAGRKAMGAGSWTTGTGNGSSNDKAEKMFGANFSSGSYGTGTLTKGFSESNGVVTGTAGVSVPMTIMKVFGMSSRQLSVSCTAKMELPNTDVMFVLDVTYSMQCAPAATSDSCSVAATGSRRIDGLQKAVKCFYEALERVSTPEPCTYDSSSSTWSSTGDPTATTSSTTAQVRIGFVPYGVNVNVGKILPNSVMGDTWTYQSRTAVTGTEHAWSLGSLSTPVWDNWTNPSSVFNTSRFGSFSNVGSSATMNDGTVLSSTISGATSSNCGNNNTLGSGSTKMAGIQDAATGSASSTSSTPTDQNPPVWVSAGNPNIQNNDTSRTRTNTISKGFKYTWSGGSCVLQRASPSSGYTTYTQTQDGTATKSITWTDYPNAVTGWTYQPRSLSVSALKAGGSTWNDTIALTDLTSSPSGASATFSGESTSRQARYKTSATVTWDGCIEEAQTVQNTDGTPDGEWATVPANAFDMNVNLIPTSPSTVPWFTSTSSYGPGSYWGPMLAKTGSTNTSVYGAVWARYSGSSSSWTTSAVTMSGISNVTGALDQDNYTYICTTSSARKLAEYSTATNFLSYVNALSATDLGTYHDIGMLWGARLISPLGIFASENATAATGGAIQRHLIFMTDGNTRTVHNNYNAYGLSYYNRYQTSYDPSTTQTDDLTNARLLAICDQIKNMNITLWVVSYGSSVNTTTQDRLKSCATPPDTIHYVLAADTATLTSQFQSIAAKISELRLTS